MASSLEKFKEIVDASETIAVRTGQTYDFSKALGGEILNQAFLKLEKKSSFDSNNLPENFKKCFAVIFNEPDLEKSFLQEENILIKLDAQKMGVSELKYEKDGDWLKIILKSAQKNPDLEQITIAKEKVPVDLLLLIDPAENEAEKLVKETPHKEIVKITSKEKGVAVKIFEILSLLFNGIDREFKEALWILMKEGLKTGLIPSPQTLDLCKNLIATGLDGEKIKKTESLLKPASFWKLLGRSLARSHLDENASTLWSFLPRADIERTGAEENMLLSVLSEIRAVRPASKFFSFLWEDYQKSVNAIIAAGDPEKLKSLAAALGTSPASSYFFVGGFKNFSEAEIKIRNSIRQLAETSSLI